LKNGSNYISLVTSGTKIQMTYICNVERPI